MPPRLFQFLTKNCRPIAIPSRRHKPADERFIRDEVGKLLREGIVESSESPWRAQVLVARDGIHKPRLVVDYSQTINRFTELDAYPVPRLDDQINEIATNKFYSTLDLKSAYHQIPIPLEDRPYTAFEANGRLLQFTRIPFGVTNGVSAFQRSIDSVISKHKLTGTYAYLDNITIVGKSKEEHDRRLQRFLDATEQEGLTLNDAKSILSKTEIKLLGYKISQNNIRPDPDRLQPLISMPAPRNSDELKRATGLFAYYAKWIEGFSEKVRPIIKSSTFNLSQEAVEAFKYLKSALINASLACIQENVDFTVECDAGSARCLYVEGTVWRREEISCRRKKRHWQS